VDNNIPTKHFTILRSSIDSTFHFSLGSKLNKHLNLVIAGCWSLGVR